MQNFQFSSDPVPPLRALTIEGKTIPPTRQEIRAFAVAKVEQIGREAVNGGTSYQHMTLDLEDQANAFAQTLDESDRQDFFRVMQEELEAAASALTQRGANFEAQAIGKAATNYQVVSIVGGSIVFALIYLLFRILS